jgi:plasmid stabilization system protein ParE
MPQVKYTPLAIRDLERLRDFLSTKSPSAARRAAEKIIKSIQILKVQPQIGRPVPEMPEEYRDWVIDFGDSGYVARYHFNGGDVTVLAIRHQKEVCWL